MKIMEAELARIRAEIARLKIAEETIVQLMSKVSGTNQEVTPKVRSRSPAIKPLVLEIMHNAGAKGASSAEVDALVRQKVPTVADDTVGSVLSRLKSDNALSYVGDRYYERQFAPNSVFN
jgi:hypothetical protein